MRHSPRRLLAYYASYRTSSTDSRCRTIGSIQTEERLPSATLRFIGNPLCPDAGHRAPVARSAPRRTGSMRWIRTGCGARAGEPESHLAWNASPNTGPEGRKSISAAAAPTHSMAETSNDGPKPAGFDLIPLGHTTAGRRSDPRPLFSHDGEVHPEGRTQVGIDAIRRWNDGVASPLPISDSLSNPCFAAERPWSGFVEKAIFRAACRFDHHFSLDGDKISVMTICPFACQRHLMMLCSR
jgi:hypothetical protein